MKRLLLSFITLLLFALKGWTQPVLDLDIFRGGTNKLTLLWQGNINNWSVSGEGLYAPFEGDSQLVVNYAATGWWAAIGFNINSWGAEQINLTPYSYMVLSVARMGDFSDSSSLKVQLNDTSSSVETTIKGADISGNQLVILPLSSFVPDTASFNWSDIHYLTFLILPDSSVSFGTLYIDNIYFTNNPPVPLSSYNTIRGKIFNDKNKDCVQQGDEPGLANYLVRATPGNYYANTNANGEYELHVDTGSVSYTIQQVLNTTGQEMNNQVCPAASHTVNLTGSGQDVCCYDFANEVRQCHKLWVEVGSNRRRRCFRNYSWVNYFNHGNLAANNVEVRVIFPEYVHPISSVPSWTSLQGNTAIYNIATLNAQSGGGINITDSVTCWNEAIRNLTQCTEVRISPANGCLIEDPAWDRSSIKVEGACIGDSVKFTVTNGGLAMQSSSAYRVFMNDTLIYNGNFILGAGEAFYVSVLSGGNTIRLEADQHPKHPGYSRPRKTIEACGGNMATAPRFLVTTTAQDDLDEFVSIHCLPILDSYDPNDKLAVPAGFSEYNYIPTSTEKIEYMIRFQNTGSDTAFTVVIKDTLDANLDISTLEIGSASHSFTWSISGMESTYLTFHFNNILLPDSTTNEPGSNGFVKYFISPLPGLPESMEISNTADIYFDYNSPVTTNTYRHTLSDQVFIDNGKIGLVEQSDVITAVNSGTSMLTAEIYPNPASNILQVSYSGSAPATLILFSTEGKKFLERNLESNVSVDISSLEKGVYIYEIRDKEGRVKRGRVVKI